MCLQPADPERQTEQLGWFSFPHIGWLPLSSGSGRAGMKTCGEGGRPHSYRGFERPARIPITPEGIEQGSWASQRDRICNLL